MHTIDLTENKRRRGCKVTVTDEIQWVRVVFYSTSSMLANTLMGCSWIEKYTNKRPDTNKVKYHAL